MGDWPSPHASIDGENADLANCLYVSKLDDEG